MILGEDLRLFLPCGVVDGAWRADGSGIFVADAFGSDAGCFPNRPIRSPAWLAGSVRYRVQGRDRELLDATGRVMVQLLPGAQPTVGPNRSADQAATPRITQAIRTMLAAPVALPATARPAQPHDLLGRWVTDSGNPRGYGLFLRDGTWSALDGCNGYGGRYAVGPGGALLTVNGGSTLVGCANSPLPLWITSAGRVGIDGDSLLFYNPRGHPLGTCHHPAKVARR